MHCFTLSLHVSGICIYVKKLKFRDDLHVFPVPPHNYAQVTKRSVFASHSICVPTLYFEDSKLCKMLTPDWGQ